LGAARPSRGASPITAAARRRLQFRRTERIHAEWPALKVLDQRQARAGQERSTAALAANVTEREVGENLVGADVNFAPLAPGDHVIEIKAGSGSELETKLIAIRVVPMSMGG
jgi:hypothetical protein